MKKISMLVATFLLAMASYGQAPQKMSYQAVVRNASNNLVTSSPVGMRISILQGSATGTAVYVETQSTTTNVNGLASVEIGSGTVVSGSMASINWAAGPYFIKTETDPAGGTTYSIIGTVQLMSVPYALYAENSGTAGPVGPTGPAGADGMNGMDGATGATGADGMNGMDGATGATGADGMNGVDGATGATGADGLVGPTGAMGATGADGAVGATGADGLVGPTGAMGATGADGAVGATGAMGATGAVGPTGPGTLSGTTNYVVKFTAATAGGDSQIQDNATCVSVNAAPTALNRFYVYQQQLTATGDAQSSLYGYRTRDSQNDGTSYGVSFTNDAVRGYNFWGDVYTFGTSGFNYNDYTRCGGVLGAEQSGSYWGSLGYKSSASTTFGVYGSSAYTSGAGFAPTGADGGIGGGFFGMIGTMSRGSVIGQINAGDLFATYNMGDVYTSGKQIELVSTPSAMIPAYSVTSTEAVVYKKGKAQLVNGVATIQFDEAYAAMLGENPVVTVTPMGDCKGVYIASVDKNGFTVKELASGNSTVEVSWIAVANRVDAATEVPSFVKDKSFNTNLDKVLFNDNNKSQSAEGIWWDGHTLQLNKNYPASFTPVKGPKVEAGNGLKK